MDRAGRILFTEMENKGKSMIKNIVFDVGKVLVDFDWQGFMDTLDFVGAVE